MSDRSGIEWTNSTWSPTLGCSKVSPGCETCYAVRTVHRMAGNPNPKISNAAAGLTARDAQGHLDWTGRVNVLPERLGIPLRWRKPRRIFVDSQSDLFHSDVPDEFIARVWAVMAATPQHTYQILTKRHGRMRSLVSSPDFQRAVSEAATDLLDTGAVRSLFTGLGRGAVVVTNPRNRWEPEWPVPGVWLGVSVEDQKRADLRIPALLGTPAAVRFLSCEPMIGPVDLTGFGTKQTYWLTGRPGWGESEVASTGVKLDPLVVGPRISWVICGGESGHSARPMHPDWARSLRDQCQAARVPFFFKQWGSWGPAPWVVRVCDPKVGWIGTPQELALAKQEAEKMGATIAVQPDGHVYVPSHKPWSLERVGDVAGAMRRFPGKTAGRVLDGREWSEFPD